MEPWIGWIRLTRGQRQIGTHPGSAWLTPPLHPAPGRESERFAMMLDLVGPAPSRLYRELRAAAAQAFWSTPGSPIAALRRAVMAANRSLLRFNRQVPSESRCGGHLACAALRADEVFLAYVGRAGSWIISTDGDEQHPAQPLAPLGLRPYAEVAIAYIPIRPGMTLLLSTQSLLGQVTPDALSQVLRRREEDLLDGLEQLAGDEPLTALVLRWPPEEPPPPPSQPSPRRRRAPPAPPPEIPSGLPPPPEEKKTSAEFPVGEPTPGESVGEETKTEVAEPAIAPWEMELPPQPSRPLSPLGGAAGGAIAQMGRRWVKGAAAVGGGTVRSISAVGRGLGAVAFTGYRGMGLLLRRALPGPERRRTALPRTSRPVPHENPRRMAALAIIILILVALTALIAWLRYGQDLRRGQALSQAHEHLRAAQQALHPDVVRSHWEAVLALTADDEDPEARALRTLARDTLDRMDGVLRVDPVLLADLDIPIVRNRLVVWEQSVAVLEGERQVRRILLSGEQEVFSLPGSPALIDIARNQPGPGHPASVLLILDAEGHLWAFDSRWSEARPVALSAVPGGHNPAAMAVYGGRLYLLDPAAGQIWRYLPQNGGFGGEAEPYFSSEAPPLSGARDMAVDGNIYVLFEDGEVARYLEGRAMPFAVTHVPPPSPRFVALAVDPDLTNGPVYLADGASDRIVLLRETGTFCAQLRSPAEEFQGLQALTISETGDTLFVLAQGKIYRVAIPPLPCR